MKPYYDDGQIQIYHGDCREVLPTIADQTVDLLLTDPPFFMPAQHYAARKEWQRSWGDTSILASWWDSTVELLMGSLKPTANFATFCDDESYPVFYPALYRRFAQLGSLVWDKGGLGMGSPWRHSHELIIAARWPGSKWTGGAGLSDVLHERPIPSLQRLHPVDKPIPLLSQIIAPTTDSGDLVVDPFMGGGGTLVAAKNLGRSAIGIEIEERYCEIAARRLSQETLDFSPRQKPSAPLQTSLLGEAK